MSNLNLRHNNVRQTSSVWYHIGAIVAILAWGASFIFTKILLPVLNPVEIYLLRCAIAYLVLLLLTKGHVKSHHYSHELLFLFCGVCGGSVYFITENTSLLYTSTTNVSLITSTAPLITAFLVGLIYKEERPNRWIVIGSVVAFVGVTMVIFNGASADSRVGFNLLGDGLAMLSAVCWSLYSLLLRRLSPFYSAMFITRKTFFYGFLTALPFLYTSESSFSWSVLADWSVWVNLLFLGLIASSLAFVVWAAVVGRLGAVKAGNYLYFQPIVTLAIAAVMLGEKITFMGLGGCVVTIAGIYVGESLARRAESRC
ncbi:MAG: DMT family transporter [Muribaculaceae bacterium]|nr:DMT family transporter [Muribaculaceae bacterium]MDE6118447.1 DMT family transporter [Muribaculaceae bacterium]